MIDAWMQHPTARHSADPIFDSLRRWTRSELTATPDVADTVAVLDEAGISHALTSAWYAPRNVMISNDEVASFVEESGGRLVGVGSVDISRPMEAMREIRRCINDLGFKAIRVLPWLWSVATKHPNVFIDTSAYTADRYPLQLVEFMRHHGSQKVLFGSNYPMITPAKALAGLDALGLDDTVRQRFLEDNAKRVFGLS